MGIKWTDLSDRQRALINDASMPLERPGIPLQKLYQVPKVKRTTQEERREQAIFANDCLRRGLPYCWHVTHAKSRATPGTPDFWVGVKGKGYWIEFKRPGNGLSEEQKAFKSKLEEQGLELHVVFSANQAIQLLHEPPNPRRSIH